MWPRKLTKGLSTYLNAWLGLPPPLLSPSIGLLNNIICSLYCTIYISQALPSYKKLRWSLCCHHIPEKNIHEYLPPCLPCKYLEYALKSGGPVNLIHGNRNRSLSVRSKKDKEGSSSGGVASAARHRFNMSTLRGIQQPELSKKLFKLIKSENNAIASYEHAGRERISIASQLSDWGESTGDESISEISDKLGVLLSEIGEQEDVYASNMEDSRAVLKQIRNTESSVQPSRDNKAKIADEIAKLKYKEPTSPKIAQLEQELVRAEAQNLVAEAQLTNIVRITRHRDRV